jgi:tetratricopeptide (TPR) repeat protein
MKYVFIIITSFLLINPMAAQANDLLELAKQKSIEANAAQQFQDMASLARQGLAYAEDCVRKHPQTVGCYYYRAINRGLDIKTRTATVKRELKKMVQDFLTVIRMDDHYDYGGAYLALGYVYLKAPSFSTMGQEYGRDLDKAMAYAKKALMVDPKFPDNLKLLGDILYKQKLYKEALIPYKKAKKNLALLKHQRPIDKLLMKDLTKLIKKTKKKAK